MNRKKLLMWAAAVLVIFMAGKGFAQEEKKGPKIVLEEDEITLFEDGKEVKKVLISRYGYARREFDDELSQKIFKKLGVTSYKEVSEKKLGRKYEEELFKSRVIKALEQPKFKFLDVNGKVVKEIDLSSKEWEGKIKESRPYFNQGEYDAKFKTTKYLIISKNGKYAVMNNSTLAHVGYPIDTGKIILYDSSGNELFVKQFPFGRSAGEMIISDIGTVAVVTVEAYEGPHNEILYAYDKYGKELLAYPKDGEREGENMVHPSGPLEISPNGRYLAARVEQVGPITAIFFDLEKNTFWKAERSYAIDEISDNGIVTASYPDRAQKKRIRVNIEIEKGKVP